MVFVYMFDLDVRWSLNVHTCSILKVHWFVKKIFIKWESNMDTCLVVLAMLMCLVLLANAAKKRRGKQSCCYFYFSELIFNYILEYIRWSCCVVLFKLNGCLPILQFVCVCVCVRACVRACVCVCVSIKTYTCYNYTWVVHILYEMLEGELNIVYYLYIGNCDSLGECTLLTYKHLFC